MNSASSNTQRRRVASYFGLRFPSVSTVCTWLRRLSAEVDWHVIASSVRLSVMMILVLLASCTVFANGQKEPDAHRKAEIVAALCSHGHSTANWSEAKAIMRQIAADNGWQTQHVPDARVLILLDLGNAYSNPWVTKIHGGKLDSGGDNVEKD